MISFINKTLGTTDKLTCVSRPRRFGKSFAAKIACEDEFIREEEIPAGKGYADMVFRPKRIEGF